MAASTQQVAVRTDRLARVLIYAVLILFAIYLPRCRCRDAGQLGEAAR